MADKTEFLQAIDDAILDADSLERFINGDDTQDVLTRLSAEYPTLQKAIKELFKNGGIAGRFKTLADLQAKGVSLEDGSYALVADDAIAANGLYVKESGLWVKSKYNLGADIELLKALIKTKPTINLFESLKLSSDTAELYQASHSVEGGFNVATMNDGAVTAVFYQQLLDYKYINEGDTITFSIDIYSSAIGASAADVTIQAMQGTKTILGTSSVATPFKTNEWHTVQINYKIPVGTSKLRFRLVQRSAGIVVKFRNPVLSSDSVMGTSIYPSISSSTFRLPVFYVSKSGNNNDNDGSKDKPYLTIQKAVDSISSGGEIIVLDDADYRESLTINKDGRVKIRPIANNNVNVFGSDRLSLTKVSSYNNIYQAICPKKPRGIGGGRGKPSIFELDTPSKIIADNERHFLHHGLSHRLPFTELFEINTSTLGITPRLADGLAILENTKGAWYWKDGYIYVHSTDSSDASLKRYEHRVRPVLTHTGGTIEMTRVTSWFADDAGFTFSGLQTKRFGCKAWGSFSNGFSDNANITISYKDRAGACGNDGFNGTQENYGGNDDKYRLESVYFDPYGHDNGDDGFSFHYKGNATIYGGLFEYNTKADVVHVTGANCVCYNTQSRGTKNGFYAATPPSLDNQRVVTVLRCVNTIANGNGYSYRSDDNAILHCDNTKSFNPDGYGYYQTGTGVIYATDCRYSGDSRKPKNGNVVIINTNTLM